MSLAWLWLLLIPGFYLLHRLALWAESEGHIYYINHKGRPSGIGNAMLEVHSLLEPEKRELVEVMRAETVEQDEVGEPPEPGED